MAKTSQEKMQDGFQAKKLLENTFFNDLLDSAEKKLLAMWHTTALNDIESQMALKAKRDTLLEIKRDIQRIAEAGDRERKKLDNQTKQEG